MKTLCGQCAVLTPQCFWIRVYRSVKAVPCVRHRVHWSPAWSMGSSNSSNVSGSAQDNCRLLLCFTSIRHHHLMDKLPLSPLQLLGTCVRVWHIMKFRATAHGQTARHTSHEVRHSSSTHCGMPKPPFFTGLVMILALGGGGMVSLVSLAGSPRGIHSVNRLKFPVVSPRPVLCLEGCENVNPLVVLHLSHAALRAWRSSCPGIL